MVCKGVQSGAWRATVSREATPLMAFAYDGASLPLVHVGRWMRKRHIGLLCVNKDGMPGTFIPLRNQNVGTRKGRGGDTDQGIWRLHLER